MLVCNIIFHHRTASRLQTLVPVQAVGSLLGKLLCHLSLALYILDWDERRKSPEWTPWRPFSQMEWHSKQYFNGRTGRIYRYYLMMCHHQPCSPWKCNCFNPHILCTWATWTYHITEIISIYYFFLIKKRFILEHPWTSSSGFPCRRCLLLLFCVLPHSKICTQSATQDRNSTPVMRSKWRGAGMPLRPSRAYM